jgi:hypothetical protein
MPTELTEKEKVMLQKMRECKSSLSFITKTVAKNKVNNFLNSKPNIPESVRVAIIAIRDYMME